MTARRLAYILKSFLPAIALAATIAVSPSLAADVEHTKDSLSTVKKMVDDEKAILVDVREQKEWDAGHVDGATLVILSELGKRQSDPEFVEALDKKLSKKIPLYVHCKSGGRCLIASKILLDLGYEARPLKPGFEELIEAGFPQAEPEDKN